MARARNCVYIDKGVYTFTYIFYNSYIHKYNLLAYTYYYLFSYLYVYLLYELSTFIAIA